MDPALLLSACDEAHYMACLVHNLSAAAKLEAGEAHVREDSVDLNDVVERAVARHAAMARARAISLDFAVPETRLHVLGDVTLIEQAASNLIHNAVRYNRAGGHVAVVLERGGRGFSLRVIDDGPGITDEELTRLPERRFRGRDASVRHPEGLGLGLHIAHDVAQRHGFELEVRRSEFGGLDVEIRGKLAPGGAAAPGPAVAGAAPGPGRPAKAR
jgi:signal transduction histidine kinase